jgi:16S rRNA (adenine1518-N6/adenine1519-N6)-dimethyltransferase
LNHRPRKRFGQNFLRDDYVIERIVAAVCPRPGEYLLEIGPGMGAITIPLLRTAGTLHVVELDRDLGDPLRDRCAGIGTLHLHLGDALAVDLASLAPTSCLWRLVGNLPYNISTPLLFHLLAQRRLVSDFHFMLQKEVVDRLAAGPGSRSFGRLSVMAQYACRVEALFDIGPDSFRPRPKVHSSFVRLVPNLDPPAVVQDESILQAVVRQAFSQRRKTLRNVLKPLVPAAELEALGIDPGARPETLSVAQYVAIANHVLTRQG